MLQQRYPHGLVVESRSGGMFICRGSRSYCSKANSLQDQAFDRAHRFGQTRAVNIYKLSVPGTVEERILEVSHCILSGARKSRLRAFQKIAAGEEEGVGKGGTLG